MSSFEAALSTWYLLLADLQPAFVYITPHTGILSFQCPQSQVFSIISRAFIMQRSIQERELLEFKIYLQ